MKKKLIIVLVIIIVVFLLVFAYARFIGTKGLIVKEIRIIDNKLPNDFHGFKIAHLSDLHYGRIINENKLDDIIDKLNALKPDIIFITGDLLDRDTELTTEQKESLITGLKRMDTSIGKYAISGNHDYDNGIKDWTSIIEKSDFVNLDDKHELVYNNGILPIVINGMSSNLRNELDINEKLKSFNTLIKSANNPDENKKIMTMYKIMIMHEPDYVDQIDKDKFDLILAGHSHNGQVRIPFVGTLIKPLGAKKYFDEHYKLNNTELYISSGLGTSTLDVRLFNKPSFNFYRLTNR